MGLQKYRADYAGEKQANGATPYYTRWVGGPTLALIRECPVVNDPRLAPRTVYITGEYGEAACRVKGKTVRGYLSWDNGQILFYRRLPWLTSRAYRVLVERAEHNDRIAAGFMGHLNRGDNYERYQSYVAKAARYRNAAAKLAARFVRKAV